MDIGNLDVKHDYYRNESGKHREHGEESWTPNGDYERVEDYEYLGTTVNWFAKGRGAKGKGKAGKGKGTVFYGNCHACGEKGHTAKFCPHWSPDPKGSGKGQKGKGKQGKGPFAGYGTWGANFFGEQETYEDIPLMAMTLPGQPSLIKTCNRYEALSEQHPENESEQQAWTEVARSKRWTSAKTPENGVPSANCASFVGLLEKTSVGLGNLGAGEWQELPKPLVIDSGAGETVMPKTWLPSYPVEPSPGSLKGEFYHTADGSRIFNEGQKRVTVTTQDGNNERAMTFQVADVDKALGSVRQIVSNKNRVVFDQDERGKDISFIQNKVTKEKMPLRVENGVYVLDLVVGPPRQRKAVPKGNRGFAWQG